MISQSSFGNDFGLTATVGAIGGYLQVLITGWLQTKPDPKLRGRVFSIVLLCGFGFTPLSYVIAGALMQISLNFMFIATAAFLLVVTLLCALGGLTRGSRGLTRPTCRAALIVTRSTPITVEVAHIRATITTIEFQIATLLPDVTRVAADVSPIGAQFRSRISFVSVSSELRNIALTLTGICSQVTSIRSDISCIGTNIAAILTQISAFSAIDMSNLRRDNTG